MTMLLNSRRFAAAGAPSAWQTVLDTTHNAVSGSWFNYTVRNFFRRALLPASATKFRVTFTSPSSGGFTLSNCFIGISDTMVFNVAPTQVFFGGNPGHVFTAANQSVTSDEVELAYGGSTDICVSFYMPPSSSGATGLLGNRNGMGAVMGHNYAGGDVADDTGGTWSLFTGQIQGITKLEAFTGGSWKNVFTSHTAYPTNWNAYTIRSKLDVGQLSLAKTIARVGIACRVTDLFIGTSAEGAAPFDFASTPTRLTFGGNNATPAVDYQVHLTDEFDISVFDPAKPLILSYHSATTRINSRTSPPAGQSSRYKAGNSVSALTWQTGSSSWGNYLGPIVIDEKY